MVARSSPPLRRSSRRDDLASDTASLNESQLPNSAAISQRAKRHRVSSISDTENLRKRKKIHHPDKALQYIIPLRNRPNDELLSVHSLPLKAGTRTPSSERKRRIPPSITKHQLAGPSTDDQDVEPQKARPSSDKRTLRSHDGGSRTKSELSLYFADYEQMLSLEPTKPGLLTAKTQITLVDDLTHPSRPAFTSIPRQSHSHQYSTDPFGARKPLHNARRIQLPLANGSHILHQSIQDPLPPDGFHRAHRKGERHEKQLRNIEKERAQHEKVQLERLLGELKGPDWLKVIGISGITESEKKLYEPKRVFFVREVAGLIEKFRHWKEEEKRRKIEREQALLTEDDEGEAEEEEDEEEAEGEADDVAGGDDQRGNDRHTKTEGGEAHEGTEIPHDLDGRVDEASNSHHSRLSPISPSARFIHRRTAPDSSDVDAAAARQLHQEAISASTSSSLTSKQSFMNHNLQSTNTIVVSTTTTALNGNPTPRSSSTLYQPPPHPPISPRSQPSHQQQESPQSHQHQPQPSGSFFSKPHLREAAIAGHRRGRHKLAFGQPVPDPPSHIFELPSHILTPDMIRKRARERRRVRRGTGNADGVGE